MLKLALLTAQAWIQRFDAWIHRPTKSDAPIRVSILHSPDELEMSANGPAPMKFRIDLKRLREELPENYDKFTSVMELVAAILKMAEPLPPAHPGTRSLIEAAIIAMKAALSHVPEDMTESVEP